MDKKYIPFNEWCTLVKDYKNVEGPVDELIDLCKYEVQVHTKEELDAVQTIKKALLEGSAMILRASNNDGGSDLQELISNFPNKTPSWEQVTTALELLNKYGIAKPENTVFENMQLLNKYFNTLNQIVDEENSNLELKNAISKRESRVDMFDFLAFSFTFLIFPISLLYFFFLAREPFTVGHLISDGILSACYIIIIVSSYRKASAETKILTPLRAELKSIEEEAAENKRRAEVIKKESDDINASTGKKYYANPVFYTPKRNSWDFAQLLKFIIALILTIAVFVSWGPLAGFIIGFILLLII